MRPRLPFRREVAPAPNAGAPAHERRPGRPLPGCPSVVTRGRRVPYAVIFTDSIRNPAGGSPAFRRGVSFPADTEKVSIIPACIVAVALAIGAISMVRGGGDRMGRPLPAIRRTRRPWAVMLLGATGLGLFWAFFSVTDREAQAYATDPSCTSASTFADASAGSCTTEPVTIERSYVPDGEARKPVVILRHADGRTDPVVAELEPQDRLVGELVTHPGVAATAQRFRGYIVGVRTPAGSFETDRSPTRLHSMFGMIAIVFGSIATGFAIKLGLS